MAKKKKVRAANKRKPAKQDEAAKMQLIVSDDENPHIQLKPGMKFEVVSVSVVEGDLLKPTKIGARLCGGSGTCVALIELDNESRPAP